MTCCFELWEGMSLITSPFWDVDVQNCGCSTVFHRLPLILSDCQYCLWKCKTSTVLMQNYLWYIMVISSCWFLGWCQESIYLNIQLFQCTSLLTLLVCISVSLLYLLLLVWCSICVIMLLSSACDSPALPFLCWHCLVILCNMAVYEDIHFFLVGGSVVNRGSDASGSMHF